MLCITVPLESEPTTTDLALLQQALDNEVPPSKFQMARENGWSLGELLTEVLADVYGLPIHEDDGPEARDQ